MTGVQTCALPILWVMSVGQCEDMFLPAGRRGWPIGNNEITVCYLSGKGMIREGGRCLLQGVSEMLRYFFWVVVGTEVC